MPYHEGHAPEEARREWFDLDVDNLVNVLNRTLETVRQHSEALRFREQRDALLQLAPDTQIIPGTGMEHKLQGLEEAEQIEAASGMPMYMSLRFAVLKEYEADPEVRKVHGRRYEGLPNEEAERVREARRAYVVAAKQKRGGALGRMITS